MFAQVALPLPLRRTFTYAIPETLREAVAPGALVEVPFRGRARRGVVVAVEKDTPLERTEAVTSAHGPVLFDPGLLAFTRWVADYYLAPWGEVLSAALPGGGT